MAERQLSDLVATRADAAVDIQRHIACRASAQLLVHGDREAALLQMMWSVERQAGLAGLGRVNIMGAFG